VGKNGIFKRRFELFNLVRNSSKNKGQREKLIKGCFNPRYQIGRTFKKVKELLLKTPGPRKLKRKLPKGIKEK